MSKVDEAREALRDVIVATNDPLDPCIDALIEAVREAERDRIAARLQEEVTWYTEEAKKISDRKDLEALRVLRDAYRVAAMLARKAPG